MQMPAFEKHVWAEIDLDALRHNFRAVKARAGEMPLCAVVKADSYGHGAVECAKVFAEEGAAWLAVSCLAEARQLRKAGLTLPILNDPRFRVNGQTNREAMIRALDEVFEIHPNGCPEPRSFRSILSTAQEEYGKAHE